MIFIKESYRLLYNTYVDLNLQPSVPQIKEGSFLVAGPLGPLSPSRPHPRAGPLGPLPPSRPNPRAGPLGPLPPSRPPTSLLAPRLSFIIFISCLNDHRIILKIVLSIQITLKKKL